MKDFFGNKIARNDHVVVLYSDWAGSAFVFGLVTKVRDEVTTFKVLKSKSRYSSRYSHVKVGSIGETKDPASIIDLEYDRPFEF